jgi:RHS repeat-associated protein
VDTNIRAFALDARFLQVQAITRIDAPLAQFSYRYDPFGRRIAKSVTESGVTTTTYFIHGEQGLMAEADSNGQITKAYGFNPQAAQQGLWGTDPLWQAEVPNGNLNNAQFHYLHTDHLGTPMLATDKSGNTSWKAVAEAFGAMTSLPQQSRIEVNLRFPGQYHDRETGTHYNFHRDYSPNTGRYLQSDPIGLDGGLNLYLYAKGNPGRFVDSLGLTWTDINNAFATAKRMTPKWYHPKHVQTWSQAGKAGKTEYFSDIIFVDSRYLGCLNDGEAGELLITIIHEIAHHNQNYFKYQLDKVIEYWTKGNSSYAQDTADMVIYNNEAMMLEYLRNRNVGVDECYCRR